METLVSMSTQTPISLAGLEDALLGPGPNYAIAARVGDRLAEMFVLIFEKQHQRTLLGHVSSEQLQRRLQFVLESPVIALAD
jgi:hypothetical protein